MTFIAREASCKGEERKECSTEGTKYRLPACCFCDKIIKLFIPVGPLFIDGTFVILFVEAAFVSLFACVWEFHDLNILINQCLASL